MNTKYLSNNQRQTALNNFFMSSFFNGLGFNFLADTNIMLLAIHFGATNTQLGYIASILHISGLLTLFVPKLFAGREIVKVYHYTWLIRGIVFLLYCLTFFFQGQTSVVIILFVYTVFCLIRTLGAVVSQPLQRTLFSGPNMGELIAKNTIKNQTARLLGRAISFLVCSRGIRNRSG